MHGSRQDSALGEASCALATLLERRGDLVSRIELHRVTSLSRQ